MNESNKYRRQSEELRPQLQRHLRSDAQDYVLSLYNNNEERKLVYHNYQRTTDTVNEVELIADSLEWGEAEREPCILAAWFHTVGYLFDYDNPIPKSQDLARGFLTTQQYPSEPMQRVLDIIAGIGPEGESTELEVRVLSDAIAGQRFNAPFFEERPLLRLEWELSQGRRISHYEWQQIQLQELLKARYYTPFAKRNYGPRTAQHLLQQKAKAEKTKLQPHQLIDEKEGRVRKFQGLEKKIPNSATQTFFRTNYRNHINLSAIADNKANIMISVNAILISVVISILSYQNIPETKPFILLPIVLFLVTGLTSLICAVLSIRPKVTTPPEGPIDLEAAKRNVVFFGNFVRMDLEQYEAAVDAVLRDGELLYGNMARDLYFLGQVLDKKYRYLTMSYNIFMVGFVATVATFLLAIFI
ncbi:MAG: Pycsar system effector family protein [Bacteroidota bacterium]